MRSRSKSNVFPTIEAIPAPPKQFIMYDVDEVAPDRLWTMARLEEATIDKIARRVVDLLAQNERDVLDVKRSEKKRGKK